MTDRKVRKAYLYIEYDNDTFDSLDWLGRKPVDVEVEHRLGATNAQSGGVVVTFSRWESNSMVNFPIPKTPNG